ncbi:MAG: hypothetical protein AAF604_07955 [Acidobacteriota bacterium]
MSNLRKLWIQGLGLVLAGGMALPLGAAELGRVEDLEPGDVIVEPFRLERSGRVTIAARGPVDTLGNGERVAAWLLDADSRRAVWVLDEDDADDKDRKAFELTRELFLEAGDYELYGAAAPDSEADLDAIPVVGTALRMLAGLESYRAKVELVSVVVRGDGEAVSAAEQKRWIEERRRGLLIDLAQLGDGDREQRGFRLPTAATVEVRSTGEVTRSGRYDYAWIADAESGEVLWQLDRDTSEPAGGAEKNRTTLRRLELPAGRYVAGVATDGSHSWQEWNAAPPHDPTHWGLTVRTLTAVDATSFDAPAFFDQQVLAAAIEVGDGEQRELAFQLSSETALRIYALGEGARREMYDYGWIVDQGSGEKVWEMTYEGSRDGGGARKNRLADEVVTLPAGTYTAYYVSDGSHSYPDWNAAPPADQERWGLTLMAPTADFDRQLFGRLTEAVGLVPLARVERVRDGVHSSQDFELVRETEVTVSALGEGTRSGMADYGWIEDRDSGARVWEMAYEDTVDAGGATKNRRVQRRLRLPAGNYAVHFRTDNSHAYGEWNADPPAQPDAWGIRVSVAEVP